MDLFVRVSNKVAIKMYQQLGYIVYRTVLEYYSGDPDEDAYGNNFHIIYTLKLPKKFYRKHFFTDMRKALSKDVKKKSVIPLTHPVRPEEVD